MRILLSLLLSIQMVGIVISSPIMVIGIAGGTASGKTTLAKKLAEYFNGQVTYIMQDSYYHDNSHLAPDERRTLNFDHPDSINFELLRSHILALKSGQSIKSRTYDFVTLVNQESVEVFPSKIILVDGILIFTSPEMRDVFDIKIFIETDDDIRFARRLMRDQVLYGWSQESIIGMWLATVKLMHDQYVQPTKSYADIVIQGCKHNDVAFDMLTRYIASVIN